jgi:hypothetical protein
LGVACFFFLPDRPESTTYLTKEEQKLAVDRMSRGTTRDIGAYINKSKPSKATMESYQYLISFENTFGQLFRTGGWVL